MLSSRTILVQRVRRYKNTLISILALFGSSSLGENYSALPAGKHHRPALAVAQSGPKSIEHFLDELGRQLRKRLVRPQNSNQLREAIQEVWLQITQRKISTLPLSGQCLINAGLSSTAKAAILIIDETSV